jgi:hypothetical protein
VTPLPRGLFEYRRRGSSDVAGTLRTGCSKTLLFGWLVGLTDRPDLGTT